MFPIRRAALRILSSSPATSIIRARSLATVSSLRPRPAAQSIFYLSQRRWASDDAETKQEDLPISKLQPTPLEEVENAVKEDEADKQQAITESIPDTQSATKSTRDAAAQIEERINANYPDRADARFQPKETIYVGNLFFDVTEEDLHKEFSTIGPVVSSKIVRDPRGLSKGFGYITFKEVKDATSAVATMNSQLFEGRRVTVQYAASNTPRHSSRQGDMNEPRNPPSKTLFIGNMSWEMTDRDLNTLFRGIRNVIDVRVAIDRRTGQPRGFAHADFIDIQSAMEARKLLLDKELYGRKLRLDYSYGSNAAPRNIARDAGQTAPPSEAPSEGQ